MNVDIEKYSQVDILDSDALPEPKSTPVAQIKRSILEGLKKEQVVVNGIQIFMIYFVGLVFHGDTLNFFDKIMIVFGGCIPLIMISEPYLTDHPDISKYLLGGFIFSDAFIIQSLSDAKLIKNLSSEFLFFAAYAIKSIHFVNSHFFKSQNVDNHKTPAIEMSETNVSLIYILSVVFFANYGNFDLMWAALVLQFLGVFHWIAWFNEEKNPLLESVIGYAFLISDTYILGVTCRIGWFLELFLFISFVPRILTLLRFHEPFGYIRRTVSDYTALVVGLAMKYNVFAACVGFMCIPCAIAIIDTEYFKFMDHFWLLNFLVLVEFLMIITLNVFPNLGRTTPWNKYGVITFTVCETYIMTFIVALYRNAGFFVGLFLLFSIGKNTLFIKKKFVGRASIGPWFTGFNFAGGVLILFEGGLILLVSYLSYSGKIIFSHYNYLLSSFIINVFIMLQVLLAPEVASKRPLCYILGIAYLLAEAYSLGALSTLIWVKSQSVLRGVTIAGFIYTSIEKTRSYADVLEPIPTGMGVDIDEDEGPTTEYKEVVTQLPMS